MTVSKLPQWGPSFLSSVHYAENYKRHCRTDGMQYCPADQRTTETNWHGLLHGCTRRQMTLSSWTKRNITTWSSDWRNDPTSSSTTRRWPEFRYVVSIKFCTFEICGS